MSSFSMQLKKAALVLLCLFSTAPMLTAQVNNNGCITGGFGVNAWLYSGQTFSNGFIPAAGQADWFKGPTGRNVIDQSNMATLQNLLQTQPNPTYERRMNGRFHEITDRVLLPNGNQSYKVLIDAVFSRDHFGGTGAIDPTSFETASKNGDDPAIWDPGPANVLGKNDIIDVAGHMFREVEKTPAGTLVKNDLWFTGLINRAEPGGAAYLDFEFFTEEVTYDGVNFSSGGPDLGHTAFTFEPDPDKPGKFAIASAGDIIFNVSLINGGAESLVEARIWVSRQDWLTLTPSTFSWGGAFDGPFNGSPYGYATILPLNSNVKCAYVNNVGQQPVAPPWGTKNTKANVYGTSYAEFSVAELGINLTALGLDRAGVFSQIDPCLFPFITFMAKTRSSASFTAQLKDFAGPYFWGVPKVAVNPPVNTVISCANPVITLAPAEIRPDATYRWITEDGNIMGASNTPSIQVDKPGTYIVVASLETQCDLVSNEVIVGIDNAQPSFSGPATLQATVSCSANTGTVTATVAGGTAPFVYQLYNGANTLVTSVSNINSRSYTFTSLVPDTYSVKVIAANSCETVSELPAVVATRSTTVLSQETVTPVTCAGINNGAINITVGSGRAPYRFQWSNGQTTEDLLNIGAGSYNLTITDADGCQTTFSYSLTQPPAVTATLTKLNDTNPDPAIANGSIDLTPAGGTEPYTYVWTATQGGIVPSGQANQQDLTGLRYGRYDVLITDANGCTFTTGAFIYEPEICNDATDNDGDGLNNCDDADCTPLQPVSVTTGKERPCVGEQVTYTVTPAAPVKAGQTYTWTVPENASIVSGQGTGTITVVWSSVAPGQVCVQANNAGCLSRPACYAATITNVPSRPGSIRKN